MKINLILDDASLPGALYIHYHSLQKMNKIITNAKYHCLSFNKHLIILLG